jgi:hypothetical protein
MGKFHGNVFVSEPILLLQSKSFFKQRPSHAPLIDCLNFAFSNTSILLEPIMKKFIFLAILAACSANAQTIDGVVPFDGVVIVAGADTASAPVIYDQPVVYNAPVHYDGTVIYNAPVTYNTGYSCYSYDPVPSGYPSPYGNSYPQYCYSPSPSVIYIGGSGSSRYDNYSPNVFYIGGKQTHQRAYRTHTQRY